MIARNSAAAPIFPSLAMTPRILMGPGPDMVHPRVMGAMGAPIVGHLDPEFLTVMERTQEMLRYLFQTKNRMTIPISGTGSAAMEACVASVVEPGDSVLVCISGYFGLRMADMARRHGGDVRTITRPWGEVFEPDDVRSALAAHPAKVVAIVHAETSTGALQPLDEIAAVVHKVGALLLVDTVTSLGGVPVHVDDIGIDLCYSGTQKCIGAPPGLGPITIGPRAEAKLVARAQPVDTWYLDLTLLQQYWGPARTYHHTAPISLNFALYEALRLICEESLEERWARHRSNAELLWMGLEEMGISLLVPHEYRLPSLTTAVIPEGVDDQKVRRSLLDEYGIEIGGGIGDLKGRVWRIGLMAETSRRANVVMLLAALQHILRR